MNELLKWLLLKLQGYKYPDTQNIQNLEGRLDASPEEVRMLQNYLTINKVPLDLERDPWMAGAAATRMRTPVISKPDTSLGDIIRTQLRSEYKSQ